MLPHMKNSLNSVGTCLKVVDTRRDATAKVQGDFASAPYVSDIEGQALYAMMSVFHPVFSSMKDSR